VTPLSVAGVDLSLTSTGLARVYGGGPLAEWSVQRVESKGLATATLADRAARLSRLRETICDWVAAADLVVIEGPSFGQARQGGQHDRAGLWWLVVDDLLARGVPVAEVTPAGRMKYATGKGNSKKDDVLAAAVRRYLDVPIQGNDIADAVLLAAMGARHLGRPVEKSLPLKQLEPMDAVRWPQVTLDVLPVGSLL
jgi:crossover junction endodeoxyribonuclease RuvC